MKAQAEAEEREAQEEKPPEFLEERIRYQEERGEQKVTRSLIEFRA